MNACGIYRMNLCYARKDLAYQAFCKIVDKITKNSIFLRRPANACEWPDCVIPVKDFFYLDNGKIMPQAIITHMISEWPLRLEMGGNLANNQKISIANDRHFKSRYLGGWNSFTGKQGSEHNFIQAFR